MQKQAIIAVRTNAIVRNTAIVLLAACAVHGGTARAQTPGTPGTLSGYDSLGAAPGVQGSASLPATAYNYYVAPTGPDTAAGTSAAPFKTLARAAKAAIKPGTTVFVAPGTYAGGFKTTGSGSAASRIHWVSTTKWGARIVPPASSVNKTAWDNRGHDVSIIGFDVDGSKLGAAPSGHSASIPAVRTASSKTTVCATRPTRSRAAAPAVRPSAWTATSRA